MELKHLIKSYFNDIIFPQNNCLICSGAIPDYYNGTNRLTNICTNCKKGLELPSENHCKVCHKPLLNSNVEDRTKVTICTDCEDNLNNFLFMNRSSILYNDFAKELISLYKYKGKESILPVFISLLSITYDKYYSNEKIDIITYVPIHSNRLEVRGFNQAERLAVGLHKYTNKPLINTLLKAKDTKKQSKQHKWERLSEIKGSFILANGVSQELTGKNVLIIDDIYTTGFTLNECAFVLKHAGASRILGLTLARAFK